MAAGQTAARQLLEALQRICTGERIYTTLHDTGLRSPYPRLLIHGATLVTVDTYIDADSGELCYEFESTNVESDWEATIEKHISQAYKDVFQGALPTFLGLPTTKKRPRESTE